MKKYTKKSSLRESFTIAEILHYAADKHLASKENEAWYHSGNKEKFSCCAVIEAVHHLYDNYEIESDYDCQKLIERIFKGLKAMGCPVNSTDAFGDNDKVNAENQQARYAWLKFAAMIAEEQGV